MQPTVYYLYELQNKIPHVINIWLTEFKIMKCSKEVHPLPRISVSVVTELTWWALIIDIFMVLKSYDKFRSVQTDVHISFTCSCMAPNCTFRNNRNTQPQKLPASTPVIYLMDNLNPFHGQLHLLTSLFCVMQETF